MERLQKRYRTPNGDMWEEWLVRYDTDKYDAGGHDEVLQYKKNGYEVGHITYHLDRNGRVMQENRHGTPTIPADAEPL